MKETRKHYHELVIVTVIVDPRCQSKYQTAMNGIVQCKDAASPVRDQHGWDDGYAFVVWDDTQAVEVSK